MSMAVGAIKVELWERIRKWLSGLRYQCAQKRKNYVSR